MPAGDIKKSTQSLDARFHTSFTLSLGYYILMMVLICIGLFYLLNEVIIFLLQKTNAGEWGWFTLKRVSFTLFNTVTEPRWKYYVSPQVISVYRPYCLIVLTVGIAMSILRTIKMYLYGKSLEKKKKK